MIVDKKLSENKQQNLKWIWLAFRENFQSLIFFHKQTLWELSLNSFDS